MRLCRETEGEVDIVSFIRPLDTLKVAESPFAKVVKSRDATLFVSWFNQRKMDSKFKDVRVRKALNYGINREELWKYGAKGNAYNLAGDIPPGFFGHNPNLELYTYDTERARSLLAEAGYPKGFTVNIITYEAWKLETQIISRMLERIGLKPQVEVLTWPEFASRIFVFLLNKPPENSDWDMTIGYYGGWYGYPALTFLTFEFLEASGTRWIEYDPVYEEMWRDMAQTVDSEKREEKIRDMVLYVYDRAYNLFIYSPLNLYAVNKEVDFVPSKEGHLRLHETSVTDKHWSVRGENQ